MLRAGYRTQVKFFEDSDELSTVEWYRAERSLGPFPHATVFWSYNWQDDLENGIFDMCRGTVFQGEVLGSVRPFTNGNPTIGFNTLTGPPCGTADQWGGKLKLADGFGVLGLFGVPVCCGGVPMPPDPFPPGCANPAILEVVGYPSGADDCDDANGTYYMCFASGHWTSLNHFDHNGGTRRWDFSLQGTQYEAVTFPAPSPEYAPLIDDPPTPGWTFDSGDPLPLNPTVFPGYACDTGGSAVFRKAFPWRVLATEKPQAIATEEGVILTTEGDFLWPL